MSRGEVAGRSEVGLKPAPVSEAVKLALEEVMTAPMVDLKVARMVLGIGRNVSYREAARGGIPSIRIGNKIKVPTAHLRRMMGITTEQPVAA